MLRRLCLALALAAPLAAASPAVAATPPPVAEPPAPVVTPELPPPTPAPTVLLLEALLATQPDQKTDDPCNRGQDCPTAVRSSLAGGLRFTYERPGSFSVASVVTLGHARDQERQPPGGYDTLQLRADVVIEINRGLHHFGLAFRVSPVLIVGWSDRDTTVRSDIPGLGLLLGRTDLWVEVGVPTLPTHDDPRFLSLVVGWKQPLFTLEGGIATFTSLTWARGSLGRTGLGPGVWLSARTRFTAESRLEASLRLALADVSSLVIGLGYHFGDLPTGAFE